jgi:two-component system, cell cycle sensor histidine kinase and response regulator CckA
MIDAGFRELADLLPQVVFETDTSGSITYANQRAFAAFGYSPTDLGIPLSTLVVEADRPRALDAMSRVLSGSATQGEEYTALRKDGTTFPILAYSAPIKRGGRVVGSCGMVVDIQEHQQSERALRERDSHLHSIVDNLQDAYFQTDASATFAMMNPAVRAMYGYEREELLGKPVETLYADPEDRIRLLSGLRRSDRISDFVARGLRKDGSAFWVSMNVQLMRDADGHVIGTEGLVRDISERQRAAEALRESEERFRKVFEEGPAGMVLTSRDLKFFSANPAFCHMLGYTVEEMSGRTFLEVTHPDHRAADRLNVERMWRGEIAHYVTEKRYLAKNGDVRWGHLSTSLIRGPDRGARYAIAKVEDITERKRAEAERARLEEQLHNAQKMEAIGTLAGGVAHDFNNILGGVMGGLSLLELELAHVSDRYRSEIEDMKGLVQRGADLAKQLLGFSRRGKYDVRPLDLALVVQKTSSMYGRTRRDITIRHDFAPDLQPVVMDHAQLEQVLLDRKSVV